MFSRCVAAVLAMSLASCACGPGPEPVEDGGLHTSDASTALDAGLADAGPLDAGAPDASVEDAGRADAGPPDAGLVPDIDVSPQLGTIDLGDVAYFAGARPPSFASLRLVIRNVGAGALFLGAFSATGVGGTTSSEICLGRFDAASGTCLGTLSGYDPARGLLAGEQIDLPVRLTPSGLGLRELLVSIPSNDPDEPVTTRRIRANAVVLPPCDLEAPTAALEFGLLGAGETLELEVALRNRLTGPNDLCLVSGLDVTGSSAFELVNAPTNITLQPGASAKLTVRARAPLTAPAALTAVTGQLEFSVASPVSSQRALPLFATFGRRCLRLSPSPWDFGDVVVGCGSAEKRFDVFNDCNEELELVSVSSSSRFGAAAHFTPSQRLFPYWGATGVVSARYRPTVQGAEQEALRLVVAQQGQQVPYVALLKGRGVAAGPIVETMPAHSGKVDVLMVIDSSCSMEDVQPALRQYLPDLLDYATRNQVDFRFAVGPSNDFGDLRRVDGGAAWLEPTSTGLASAYRELVDVGTLDGRETCVAEVLGILGAGKQATSINGSFLREDAAFSVICITDTPDFAIPARDLPALFDLKGPQRRSLYRHSVISAFSPPPMGCNYAPLSSSPTHNEFIGPTEGAREELCTSDWPGSMQRLASASFDRRTSYDLVGTPDLSAPSGVQVRVNGVPWPEFSATMPPVRQWSYDVVRNRVAFNAFTQPPVGSVISVSYERACLP